MENESKQLDKKLLENIKVHESDWIVSHEKILECWEEIYNEGNGKRPTFVEISKRTGLTRQTVAAHLKEATFEIDISPKHMMNINPMLDEFYNIIHDPEITPYAKGKLILEYVKLIGNPTEKREVKQLEATKLFIEIADNKKIKDVFDATEVADTDESK